MSDINIKKILVLLITTVFLVSSINIATANQQQGNENIIYVSYTFNTPQTKSITEYGKTYTQLTMDGCINYGYPGEPSLPVKVAKILLPPHSRVKNIQVTSIGKHHLTISNEIKIGGNTFYSYSLGELGEGIVVSPDENGYSKIYSKENFSTDKTVNLVNYDENNIYPGKIYNDNSFRIQYKRGYPITMLSLYPVQYKKSENLVIYYDKIDVRVEIEKDSSLSLNEFYRGLPRDEALIRELVDNPSTLNDYDGFSSSGTYDNEDGSPPDNAAGSGSSSDDGSQSAGSGGSQYGSEEGDLLIITTPYLYKVKGPYNLQALAAAHEAEGRNVTIITTNEIGGASKERIKNAIKTAYKQGVDYVLLVGDDDWEIGVVFYFFVFPIYGMTRDIYDSQECYIPTYPVPVMKIEYLGYGTPPQETPPSGTHSGPEEPAIPNGNETSSTEPDIPNQPTEPTEPIDPIEPIDPGETGQGITPSGGNIGAASDENEDVSSKSNKIYSLLNHEKRNSFIDIIIQKLKSFFTKILDIFSEKKGSRDNSAISNNPEENNGGSNNQQHPTENNGNSGDQTGYYGFGVFAKKGVKRNGSSGSVKKILVKTASDLPYACFDDGDPMNEDYFAEVYIGRASVSSAEDLRNFVKKTIEYMEDEPPLDALLAGERLGFGGVMEYACNSLDETIDRCTTHYLTDGIQSSIYYIHKLYRKSKPWDAYTIISKINNGEANILNHLGHANWRYCIKLTPKYIRYLTNSEYGIWYSQGCFGNAYDYKEGISEYFTVKGSNGAVAFIGNSWYGWGKLGTTDGPSQKYCRQFWDAIFGEGKTTLGQANQDSKEDNIAFITPHSASFYGFAEPDIMRSLYYGINLLGDPTLKVKGATEPARYDGYDGPSSSK